MENEFFVLPYESSLCLKVQNNIMHGRSLCSIDACSSSETTRHMEEAGASWAQIRANDDFTTLERTCYCSALSNFQDETVVSAGSSPCRSWGGHVRSAAGNRDPEAPGTLPRGRARHGAPSPPQRPVPVPMMGTTS